ncbi:MAG: glycoside hydrolase family 44 protein [Terracidiphilus sp.]
MKNPGWYAAVGLGTCLCVALTACGGGGSSSMVTGPTGPTVTSITVTPSTATIGSQVQFVATVAGTGSFSTGVSWSILGPPGSQLSTGTLSTTGLYTTPYPAPATVTVSATSTEFPAVVGSTIVTLSPPATAAGPTLTVDAGNPTHAISPYIYGMDAYLLDGTAADAAAVAPTNITIDRWGGDSTERYNYKLDVTNDISDYYFENTTGNSGDGWLAVSGTNAFDTLVNSNNSAGIKTLGTVPVLGWVAKDNTSCSFPVATYPNQLSYSPSGCGDGTYAEGVNSCTNASGCNVTGNDPKVTSIAEPPPTPPAVAAVNAAWAGSTWAGGWVATLVSKFGPGNPSGGGGKGVAIYDLDNEPNWWDSGSKDVHPNPSSYDELTNGGIGTALAIKTEDPTAEVSGPVTDYWWAYFYSKKDIESGWGSGGPCYQPWSNPIDRKAHNGIPFIEYYLQQMAQAEKTYGMRLLDYLDLHTYFAATYPAGSSGKSVAFAAAGDTGVQQARLNSTRALWDSTYTDPNFVQPNYTTDANFTSSCAPPAQAPQLIPMMRKWVATDYPGTKLAIDEYNWGGMESINGALAQADILGIFGREGLDVGTMWPTSDPSGQIPGMMAFAMYRNYDGNNSTFGDMALSSTSIASGADAEGSLAIYGALRSSDKAVTIMVINKTYGDLTESLSLANVNSSGPAESYLYSNANLAAIVKQPNIPLGAPAAGSTILITTFPAQSMTLLVVPQ